MFSRNLLILSNVLSANRNIYSTSIFTSILYNIGLDMCLKTQHDGRGYHIADPNLFEIEAQLFLWLYIIKKNN